MNLNDLALLLDLPKLAMERNIYSLQVRDNELIMGASRNTFKANSIHIWFDGRVNLDYIQIKKPKYNNLTKQMTPFSKKVVNQFSGEVAEAKEYLYNNFGIH